MDTPIYDFLRKYAAGAPLRCHMPGHKGYAPLPELGELYQLDITEIAGADSLFEANGIICRSERNMSSLYDTADTLYSAGGSTLCIQAMLTAMKHEERRIIAVRNVHRSFLNAAALLGLDVEWLMPEYSGGILSGAIDLTAAERMLRQAGKACLYVTSPDYTGKVADIPALSELAHRYGAPLLVDNAHGAHLRFTEKNTHPIALGADMCCDSAHKMLPALTGAAMLHISHTAAHYAGKMRQYMGLFGSTSPSYLIMASLDLCCRYISDSIEGDIRRNTKKLRELRSHFSGRLRFAEGDIFHISVLAAESGYSGCELAELLRIRGIECEYADEELLILLMSPMSRSEEYERLTDGLEAALKAAVREPVRLPPVTPELPERAMSIREAVFAPAEEIPSDEAEGRICGAVNVPCPPAVPIAASGEIIDRRCIDILKRYGIQTINVVKNKNFS